MCVSLGGYQGAFVEGEVDADSARLSCLGRAKMNFPIESAVNEMPEEARAALSAALEHMQVRDSLKMYNSLVERCFKECNEDMRSKSMSTKEEQCVAKCCEKFMHVTGRVGMRFSEFFSQMELAAQQQMEEAMKKK